MFRGGNSATPFFIGDYMATVPKEVTVTLTPAEREVALAAFAILKVTMRRRINGEINTAIKSILVDELQAVERLAARF